MPSDLRISGANRADLNPARACGKPSKPSTFAGFAGFSKLGQNLNPARSIRVLSLARCTFAGFAGFAGFRSGLHKIFSGSRLGARTLQTIRRVTVWRACRSPLARLSLGEHEDQGAGVGEAAAALGEVFTDRRLSAVAAGFRVLGGRCRADLCRYIRQTLAGHGASGTPGACFRSGFRRARGA